MKSKKIFNFLLPLIILLIVIAFISYGIFAKQMGGNTNTSGSQNTSEFENDSDISIFLIGNVKGFEVFNNRYSIKSINIEDLYNNMDYFKVSSKTKVLMISKDYSETLLQNNLSALDYALDEGFSAFLEVNNSDDINKFNRIAEPSRTINAGLNEGQDSTLKYFWIAKDKNYVTGTVYTSGSASDKQTLQDIIFSAWRWKNRQ